MRVIVFDLDGTLIKMNTFNIFLIYVVKRCLSQFRLFDLVSLLMSMILRKSHLLTRAQFKKWVHRICQRYYAEPLFLNLCMKQVNAEVLDELMKYLSDDINKVILNTAALPYAKFLSDKLRIDNCLHSYEVGGCWFENSGLNKILSLNEVMELECVDVLYTDDLEDLPIIEMSESVVMVSANIHTINKLNERGIRFRNIL
jgi:phosphoserine phosphatase